MKQLFTLFIILIFLSCSTEDSQTPKNNEDPDSWLVDENDISGALDLYPLGESPEYASVQNTTLDDDERVGIMRFGSEIRVYPYSFTYQTEIVNDAYNSQNYAFSYCPLTKSAIAFHRNMTYRASGYLYKDNMVPWDEATNTFWSQMLMKGIKGVKANERLNTLPVIETTWKIVKTHFPEAKVIKVVNPTERTNNDDPEVGELLYGILDDSDNVKIFRYEDFIETKRYNVIMHANKYIVVGDYNAKIISAFKVNDFDDYQNIEDEFPNVLKHINGETYNVLGIGDNGGQLAGPKYAYVAAWWAWEDFFSNIEFQE